MAKEQGPQRLFLRITASERETGGFSYGAHEAEVSTPLRFYICNYDIISWLDLTDHLFPVKEYLSHNEGR